MLKETLNHNSEQVHCSRLKKKKNYLYHDDAISTIHIGIIGMGYRGIATLKRYLIIDGIEINAICDNRTSQFKEAKQCFTETNKSFQSVDFLDDWHELCKMEYLDLILICTDWETHAEMGIYAMKQHKHVALEVPAAMDVSDCWKLVHTAHKYKRHCTMLENCCFDPFALCVHKLVNDKLFGDILHVEGGYIHDLRDRFERGKTIGGLYKQWAFKTANNYIGNPYPTHGLGPVCKVLNIPEKDRLDYLVSVSAQKKSETNIETTFHNTTIIKTRLGKTIVLEYNVQMPRPYSRIHQVCGTEGFAQKYPLPIINLPESKITWQGKATDDYPTQYLPKEVAPFILDAKRLHVDNVMNYLMDRRLIYCLHKGLPLDITVEDAATWSSIAELTNQSCQRNGARIAIPDFYESE